MKNTPKIRTVKNTLKNMYSELQTTSNVFQNLYAELYAGNLYSNFYLTIPYGDNLKQIRTIGKVSVLHNP